jgi:hypothetical protein
LTFKFNKMEFNNISIEEFVEQTIKKNPEMNSDDLFKDLEEFKKRKFKGELCHCGNPIWIIGSALSGKACFTCITGESDYSDDYEIA